MTASPEEFPDYRTGFRFEQLAAAFDRVMNPRDWKAPIRSVIPAAERDLVEQAVLWFTEAAPRFEPLPGKVGHLVVTAPGYRVGAAAESAPDPSTAPQLPRMRFPETETAGSSCETASNAAQRA